MRIVQKRGRIEWSISIPWDLCAVMPCASNSGSSTFLMRSPRKTPLLSCVSFKEYQSVHLRYWFSLIILSPGGGGTVWVPLVEQCRPYERVGIVGIGGLGHLTIQYASKMGCDVVAFSSTEEKREEALKLGANEFYATKGIEDYSLLGLKKPVDRLLITTSAKLDIGIFYPILNRNATIVPLSVDGGNFTAPYFPTVYHGQRIIGSCVCSQFLQYV